MSRPGNDIVILPQGRHTLVAAIGRVCGVDSWAARSGKCPPSGVCWRIAAPLSELTSSGWALNRGV